MALSTVHEQKAGLKNKYSIHIDITYWPAYLLMSSRWINVSYDSAPSSLMMTKQLHSAYAHIQEDRYSGWHDYTAVL